MSARRRLFGTDGIRGLANQAPITPHLMMQVAMAAAKKFAHKNHRNTVVIGKDTRLSGYMIETALTSGFVAMGMDVSLLGPIPTPGVALLTRSMRADLGVMISASHNPFEDNGVKFFGPDGFKLSDQEEAEIEFLIDQGISTLADPKEIGKVRRLEDAGGRYNEFVKSTFPRHLRLDGIRIVLDCANGAAYKIAPQVLWELGAEVIQIGTQPNGMNINEGVGATAPKLMAETVINSKAHLGIALDGDADRIIMADEKGTILSGDQLMGLLALSQAQKGLLRDNTVVTTHMSNLGLERYLNKHGIRMVRTAVGDRYVIEEMKKEGYTLGGEQSGHIILADHSTTGDGFLTALQILRIFIEQNHPFSVLANAFPTVPQLLKNVRVSDRSLLEAPSVVTAIQQAKTDLENNNGRLLVRFSGTEPVLRLMGEADDPKKLNHIIDTLENAILKA